MDVAILGTSRFVRHRGYSRTINQWHPCIPDSSEAELLDQGRQEQMQLANLKGKGGRKRGILV